jgi:hypothetical protein
MALSLSSSIFRCQSLMALIETIQRRWDYVLET